MHNINKLPRSNPKEQGVNSFSISSFLEEVKKNNLALSSFMFIRHGFVVSEGWWEPYSEMFPHMLFSLSKSFTGTAIGLAIEEGLLSLEDNIVSFFIDELPNEISENLASMKVKHLLSMVTGHAKDNLREIVERADGDWVKGFLDVKVDYEPGTHFVYNTGASYMLSAIISKITGQTLLEYLEPRLFEPLKIHKPIWESCPRGINMGGWGLRLKTEDIAKFGQLYLQKGMYNGVRILSEKWVDEATTIRTLNGEDENNDWTQGYGYQFWRCRYNAYRADGAFGQYCIIMPDEDAVIVITSGVDDMQSVLNLVWEHLKPSMDLETLLPNYEEYMALNNKLINLKIPVGKTETALNNIHKLLGKSYAVNENIIGIKTLILNFNEDTCNLNISDHRGEHEICCGINRWQEGNTDILGKPVFKEYEQLKIYTQGIWENINTFVVTAVFVETPFVFTVTFYFSESVLNITAKMNPTGGLSGHISLEGTC